MMLLEFKDNSQLQVRDVFGFPTLVNGIVRDTLRFEVDPEESTIDALESIFNSTSKTDEIYYYEDGEKRLMGEGYNIFVSVNEENKKIPSPPGRLVPERFERIYIVMIAQMTYEEHEGMR